MKRRRIWRSCSIPAWARKTLPADPQVLADWENPNETWQWYDEISSRTSLQKLSYRDERVWISASGSIGVPLPMFGFETEYFSWRLWRDWSTYDFELNRAGQSSSLSHSVRVRNGKLETEIMEGGDGMIRGTADVPGVYIPSGLLPLVLGKLPLEPMILSTDSFPATAGALPGLILLRLEPAFDMPRKLPGAAEPMRCSEHHGEWLRVAARARRRAHAEMLAERWRPRRACYRVASSLAREEQSPS